MARKKLPAPVYAENVGTDGKPATTGSGQTPAPTDIICPVIQVQGEKHPLQQEWDKHNYPELRAVGYGKLEGRWVSYIITTKGPNVTKIEIDEPNMRQIAEESAKVNFVTTLMDRDL